MLLEKSNSSETCPRRPPDVEVVASVSLTEHLVEEIAPNSLNRQRRGAVLSRHSAAGVRPKFHLHQDVPEMNKITD